MPDRAAASPTSDPVPLTASPRPTQSSPSNKFGPLFSSPYRQRQSQRRPRRRSVDSARHRGTNPSFFEHESTVFVDVDDDDHNVPSTATVTMKDPQNPDSVRSRRQVLRIDAQDGPWTISVAEDHHDPNPSYSLYVKTPTHNLTLTRTAREIADLHAKLREVFPHAALPSLPFDPATLPQPKRKSAFLNTLSRLASPARTTKSPPSSFHPTPLISPRVEQDDPFASLGVDGGALTQEQQEPQQENGEAEIAPQSQPLSAYLTALANDQLLRTARAWKRFVRVRTDDLESVRVERAIKRVRSDLAAHVAGSTVSVHVITEGNGSLVDGKERKKPNRVREESTADANGHSKQETETTAVPDTNGDVDAEPEPVEARDEEAEKDEGTAKEDEVTPATPVATDVPRIPRSQSADPDKAARLLARAFAPSSASESSAAETTGDETTASTSATTPSKKKTFKARNVSVTDFEMLRVLGKGCAGKVLLVRYHKRGELYALKAITKRHVLAHQELQHTLTEQAVLKRMAGENRDPFVVRLHWSFHDKENLFLVMDFHPGGDLATQLARWGRLGRDRARFYAAEIVEGVEGLHAAGVIYRDLKPENILIAHDGHIVLTDFGLSKEFARKEVPATTAPSSPNGRHTSFEGPYWMTGSEEFAARDARVDTTSTFCGTAEYLAPEVIQGLPYSYEVDWWSFGTMLYEMLTGITPFWADNHSDMYVRVLQDELQFPDDRAMDQDTKSLLRGLLQRNPALRIREPRIKKHPYFSMIDWSHVYFKRYIPPYIPPIDPSNASDTQNFDDTFLDMEPVINDVADEDETDQEASGATESDRDSTPSGSRSSSAAPPIEDEDTDVFDGYSFKGRHSVIIDDGVAEGDEAAEGEEEEEGARSILGELEGIQEAPARETEGTPEPEAEPKTPEARKAPLPAEQPARPTVDTTVTPAPEAQRPQISPTKETLAAAQAAAAASNGPDIHRKEPKTILPPQPPAKKRREKSGVPQLDAGLSEREGETEAEDEDWDFVDEADANVRYEERNGAKGSSLFARGVVDRYRLAVFRNKTSTPSRSVSGASQPPANLQEESVSASPVSAKERRGRSALAGFRKAPKQFLRPKSPRASGSALSVNTAPSSTIGSSRSLPTQPHPSTVSSHRSLASTATHAHITPGSPSLRSKPSATSFGSPPSSSDASVTEETAMAPHDESLEVEVEKIAGTTGKEKGEKVGKKSKKLKEGAEKVLSLFASPR